MRGSVAMRAALVAIGANLLLLGLKIVATTLSDSLTIFSETLNSLADLVAAVVILLCVRWAWMRPDETHPFGHQRAEPIAGLVVAILTGILGFEVCRTAVGAIWDDTMPERIGPYPIGALCFTVGLKALLTAYFTRCGKALHSPALRAAAVDSRNDVLVALLGLIALVVAEYGLLLFDVIAAALVGTYILYSAHRIGMENIDYLMGRAPDEELLERIRAAAEAAKGVRKIDDIKAHYVGVFVHVELTARVDGTLSTADSHDVCEVARAAVESLELVNRAFVHMAPLRGEPTEPLP